MVQQQQISRAIEIENGLDFIINHFDPTILYFPRTVMTKKLERQEIVYAREEALDYFQQSEFQDCRINAYRYSFYSNEEKDFPQWTPDLIFIDIDRNENLKNDRSFDLVLSNTLKNITEKLNGFPTVLFTGEGYHIYQPIEGVIFENYPIFHEFNSQYDLFKEFLRFSKKFFSNYKADKNSNPSLRSCLLRIPGSINFKYNNRVKIVQKWNGYRPPVSEELLEDFRTYLIQKQIKEYNYRQKTSKVKRYKNNNYGYYDWIEKKILANPFEDCRKIIVDLILAPYLINIKKMSYDESYQMIKVWLDKCNSLQKLDNYQNFVNYRIYSALKTATQKGIGPMSLYKIKTDNRYSNSLSLLISQKGKSE